MPSPFNLPDNAYQFWKDFKHDERIYTFEHLISSKHTFTHPTRPDSYTLYFTFSHHVFTKTIQEGDARELIYPFPPKDLRTFDEERYLLSKSLPEIIKSLPDQFCYHGGYSRYCCCKIKNEKGIEVHYQVVYRVWKARGKMRFHIESAYPLPERPSKVKKVNFWVICHNLLRGKKLPKPAN